MSRANVVGNQDAKDQDDAVDEGQHVVGHQEGGDGDVLQDSGDRVTLGGQDCKRHTPHQTFRGR
jgi:hypothetical protein